MSHWRCIVQTRLAMSAPARFKRADMASHVPTGATSMRCAFNNLSALPNSQKSGCGANSQGVSFSPAHSLCLGARLGRMQRTGARVDRFRRATDFAARACAASAIATKPENPLFDFPAASLRSSFRRAANSGYRTFIGFGSPLRWAAARARFARVPGSNAAFGRARYSVKKSNRALQVVRGLSATRATQQKRRFI